MIKNAKTILSISAGLNINPASPTPNACNKACIIPGSIVKKKAPNNGPNTVPTPPIITIATNVIEYKRLKLPGSTPPDKVKSNEPAIPP
jgi:hypothetical protein